MSSWRERATRAAAVVALGLAAQAVDAQSRGPTAYPGIGRAATPTELAAWDIDVRPDFKGLPKGSGTVAAGQDVWEDKCASCHGIFGESNEVFAPMVGGTTKDDLRTGRVARLTDPSFPGRTTLMKLSTVSTLWDYIHRAMPWTRPKTLTIDEVYAVTAYILNLGGIVPDDFTLTDRTIRDVRLPNRDGTTTNHGLWPGDGLGGGRPDVLARACMRDCGPAPKVASSLPDYARNQHGNLAEQNRRVGPQRGVDTTRPPAASLAETVALAAAGAGAAAKAGPGGEAGDAKRNATGSPTNDVTGWALAQRHACTACHGVEGRLVGPSFTEVAARHGARADAVDYLAGRIKAGGSGAWGAIPMPPQSLGDADAMAIARWIAAGPKAR